MAFALTSELTCIVVDGGHRAVLFDRLQGVKDNVKGEGLHFLIPWIQKPIVFDILFLKQHLIHKQQKHK